jgi:hypothetical protein
MSDKNINLTPSADDQFIAVFGWLTAAAVSIASWAVLN